MRGKSPELLTPKQSPTLDEKFLVKSPAKLLLNGELRRKNILLGANSHEGSNFIVFKFPDRFPFARDFNANVTSEQYREMIQRLGIMQPPSSSDVVIDTIASIYLLPCGSQGNTGNVDGLTYFMALSEMFGDVWFKCPVLNMAKSYGREVIWPAFLSVRGNRMQNKQAVLSQR